jgi:diguanylate cyclase (GGDEF)-like protein
MTEPLAPNLLAVVDQIEEDRTDIASEWVKVATVVAVFESRHISPKKFQEGYGVPIIEYFISVIRAENEAGDCPVMSQLVNFLLEKEITPKEVFDICMGFRRSLITYLFNSGHIADNAQEMMEEVALLFDANLSGVLDIFGKSYKEKQQRLTVLEQHDKKFKQILRIINAIRTKIFIAYNGHIILGNKPFFHTFGLDNFDAFQNRFENNWSFIESLDIEKELFEEDKAKWLQSLCRSDRHFKAEIYHDLAKKKLLYSGRVTMLPDTDPAQYVITLNNIAPHIENEAQIREKFYLDEMTGFYNHARFEQLITQMQVEAREVDKELALAVIDIPELKEINENRGRDTGDTLIMEIAQMITMHTDESMIVARLEGSRFGVLRAYKVEQECYDWAEKLLAALRHTKERINVILTGFDLAETPTRLLMRGFDLTEIADSSDENRVYTDLENVDLEALPAQQPFIDKIAFQREIETTLYYKELPLSGRNRVLSVDKSGMRLHLEKKQLVVARGHELVYFKLPQFGFIKARIDSADISSGTVLVNQFRFDKHSPLGRKKFRVKAPEGMICRIVHEERAFEGSVMDLNDVSIAVNVTRKKNLDDGSTVKLSMPMQFSDSEENFETEAAVKHIEKRPNGYKIVFGFALHGNVEALYNQFMADRQMELIQQLKNAEQRGL